MKVADPDWSKITHKRKDTPAHTHHADLAVGVLVVVVDQGGVLHPGNPVLAGFVVQHALEGTGVILQMI